MALSFIRRIQPFVLVFCLAFSLGTMPMYPSMAATPVEQENANLQERIQFSVKWWFVPLVDTYMETYSLPNQETPDFYRLTHQAAVNTFWNDRMESIINSRSLLPLEMETIIKDKDGQHSKNRIIFERDRGTARLLTVDPESGKVVVRRAVPRPARGISGLSACQV